MAFAVDDYRALVQLLLDHPEWRAELRPLILGEEMAGLPNAMERLLASDEELREQIRQLASTVTSLASSTTDLVAVQKRSDGRMGNVEGRLLELRYGLHARSWFGKWLRSPEVVAPDDLVKVDQAHSDGRLDDSDIESLRLLDFIVRGRDRQTPGEETLLAVEISGTIDREDVERASARAAILGRVGYRVIALVGGEAVTAAASELAQRTGVLIDLRRGS